MTFEVILIKMKYLCLYNVSIHIKFYQNQFVNECARKINAKIPESQRFTVFFAKYRRTYVLKNNLPIMP